MITHNKLLHRKNYSLALAFFRWARRYVVCDANAILVDFFSLMTPPTFLALFKEYNFYMKNFLVITIIILISLPVFAEGSIGPGIYFYSFLLISIFIASIVIAAYLYAKSSKGSSPWYYVLLAFLINAIPIFIFYMLYII